MECAEKFVRKTLTRHYLRQLTKQHRKRKVECIPLYPQTSRRIWQYCSWALSLKSVRHCEEKKRCLRNSTWPPWHQLLVCVGCTSVPEQGLDFPVADASVRPRCSVNRHRTLSVRRNCARVWSRGCVRRESNLTRFLAAAVVGRLLLGQS